MTYVQVEDSFPDHPKVIGASDAAVATWLRGLCYASRYQTDGALTRSVLGHIGKLKAARELVERGLWDETATGWQIHDYGHIQRTRADIDATAVEKGKAGTLGNHKRWHVARGIVADNCKWCRNGIAGASDVGIARESLGNRETSPERDREGERDRERDAEEHQSLSRLSLVGDPPEREQRVVAALWLLAETDLEFGKQQGDGIHAAAETAYLNKCLTARRRDCGDRLDLIASEHPSDTPQRLCERLAEEGFLAS